MGSFLILGARSTSEAIDFIGEPQLTQTWEPQGNDTLFTDTALSDAACAALYAGYTPSGVTNANYVVPLPPTVEAAIDTLRTFYQNDPPALTDAMSATVSRAQTIVLRYLFRELMQ